MCTDAIGSASSLHTLLCSLQCRPPSTLVQWHVDIVRHGHRVAKFTVSQAHLLWQALQWPCHVQNQLRIDSWWCDSYKPSSWTVGSQTKSCWPQKPFASRQCWLVPYQSTVDRHHDVSCSVSRCRMSSFILGNYCNSTLSWWLHCHRCQHLCLLCCACFIGLSICVWDLSPVVRFTTLW